MDESNINYGASNKLLMTVQTAKGLEFDMVIIYNRQAFEDNIMDLRLLYVASTRPLHKLIICNESSTK
ncbi:MAG: ATP-binding domain-containing protein [Firmicutes bacterium]|nr:ATP-binding domain-containing protein [Bacillota bacterium]